MGASIKPVEAGETHSFDGTRLSFEVYGRGERTILCCNGIACTAHAYWEPIVDALAGDARVILWDYRGHGRSGPPENSAEVIIPSFARDAIAVLEATDASSAALIGHSMGVQVILEIFRAFPEAAEALIAVAGPYERPLGSTYGLPIGRFSLPFLEFATEYLHDPLEAIWHAGFRTDLPYLIARAGFMVGPNASRDAMRNYFKGLGDLDIAMLVRMFRAMDMHSAADVLPSVDIPTLIVAGGIDVLTPPWIARRMAAAIKDADLLVIPSAGHALPIEAPEELNGEVTRFLAERVWTAQREAGTKSR
ncbi:MAG: hypothetical protein DCC49_02000 [Acidobacteria bacterium]|nr:MAG: hypothetical protein DCC49_02000 [Acidobacteriota bacterium]